MRFEALASSSKGNAYLVIDGDSHILLECGLTHKKLSQLLGFALTDVQACLVTHEHKDHSQCVKRLLEDCVQVYLTRDTAEALELPDSLMELAHEIRAGEQFTVGSIDILPFQTYHDAAEPVGFRIESGGKSMAVATDMGVYSEYTIRHLRGLDALLLEANHDIHMLEVGRYPYYLKMRILSEKGHLSNEASGRLLTEVLHDGIRHIVLGHLSKENNYPALAYETVCAEVTLGDCPYRAGDFPIHVAERDKAGDLFRF